MVFEFHFFASTSASVVIVVLGSHNDREGIVVGLIHEVSELLCRRVLDLPHVPEVRGLDPHNGVALLSDKLHEEAVSEVLESRRESVGHPDILLADGLRAVLASVETLTLLHDLLLAIRATDEVDLALVIINDSLDVTREFVVLALRTARHHGVILVDTI